MKKMKKDNFNRILIADDDPEMVDALSLLLEEEGFSLIKVENGVEAVKAAAKEFPALIMMDIHMPKMNGLEACKEIKANPVTKSIPIVMLTVEGSLPEIRQAIDLGAKTYITKASTKEEILNVVKSILS